MRAYDISMYMKDWQELSTDKRQKRKIIAETIDNNDEDETNTEPRIPTGTSVPPLHSQDDDSSVMEIEKDM